MITSRVSSGSAVWLALASQRFRARSRSGPRRRGFWAPTFSSLETCRTHGTPTIVLPTLAYQLAYFDDEFKSELADVLAEYPYVPADDLDIQFKQYIQRAVGSLQVVEIEDGACGP